MENGNWGWKFTLTVDPATIGTAQQKRFDPRTRRFFTDRRVAAGMKVVTLLAKAQSRKSGAWLPPTGSAVSLSLVFFYAVPPSRRRKTTRLVPPREGAPCRARWAGDCDNRAKAVIDALTKAGFWPDDQFVTTLHIEKRWTLRFPRIEVGISSDEPNTGIRADAGANDKPPCAEVWTP